MHMLRRPNNAERVQNQSIGEKDERRADTERGVNREVEREIAVRSRLRIVARPVS